MSYRALIVIEFADEKDAVEWTNDAVRYGDEGFELQMVNAHVLGAAVVADADSDAAALLVKEAIAAVLDRKDPTNGEAG